MENSLLKWARIATSVVMYLLIVFFGVVLLAEVQLRSAGGSAFDTWRLNFEANYLLNNDLVKKIDEAENKARSDKHNLAFIQMCLRFFDKDTGLPRKELIDEQTAKEIEDAKNKRINPDTLPNGPVFCMLKGYTGVQIDIAWFENLTKENPDAIADLKKSLTSNKEQYADLIKGHPDFLAFKEMANLWYHKPFFVMPYDLLVMLMVVFMGAFGGMVRLLRDYGAPNRSNPTEVEYLLVPLIGAVVAIGGYVLAKCGLLLLSSSSGETSLSPFMISLVGIVSGLLAKEVIDKIAAQGSKILGTKETDETVLGVKLVPKQPDTP